MANVVYANFPIPADTNVVQPIWKLTRAMKKAGWNVVAHSDGTTKTAAGTNANDSWGSNADPSNDIYPSAFDTSKAPWIVMSGPVTLRIRLNAAPTGTFFRGETITQATSAAEGELLGYTWSVADGYGWAVILPRTGTFDNSHIITGSSSSATFVPTGTIQTYNREIMIGKTTANNTTSGQLWYICCDGYAESTSLFSYLATQSGCTATVPPGSGGTGNGFPTFGNVGTPTGGAIALRGTGGATTEAAWFGSTNGFTGNAQIACVNATPSTGISADGSFYLLMANNSWDPTTFHGWAYQRVDDGDPGDVDPYVWINYSSATPPNWVRTSSTSFTQRGIFLTNYLMGSGSVTSIFGYAARGVTTSSSVRDIAFGGYCGITAAIGGTISLINTTAAVKLLNSPSVSNAPTVREKILAYCVGSATGSFHFYKGRFRWMFVTSVGSKLQTSDGNTFLCIATNSSTTYPAAWIGPYDGYSTPS